jgi:hypothetical protein
MPSSAFRRKSDLVMSVETSATTSKWLSSVTVSFCMGYWKTEIGESLQKASLMHTVKTDLPPYVVELLNTYAFIIILTECPQCYCGEIRQNLIIFCQSLLSESFPQTWSFDMYRWISQEEIIPKPNIFTGTGTLDSFRVCELNSWSLLAEKNKCWLGAILLSYLFSELQKTSSSRLELRTVFRRRSRYSCNLLAERNNFGLRFVILLCSFSEQQKLSSPGVEPRTVFRGSDLISVISSSNQTTLVWAPFSIVLSFRATENILVRTRTRVFRFRDPYSCNLLAERNNFGLCAVLLSCSVSALIGKRSFEFWPAYGLFLISRNKHAKFSANQCVRSRNISEQTHKQINIPRIWIL